MFRLCTVFFFFNDTATTEIYTLSLHDALPISGPPRPHGKRDRKRAGQSGHRASGHQSRGDSTDSGRKAERDPPERDRKSTRLNSSHTVISYAVFCLKKKKKKPR